MMAAGYSGTPLIKKLGIKEGFTIAVHNPPDGYWQLLGDLPAGVAVKGDGGNALNFVHVFVTEMEALEAQIDRLRDCIKSNGMIWVSWPQKAASCLQI